MAFCHIIVTVLSLSSPQGDYEQVYGIANCSFQKEGDCLVSLKELPVGAITPKGTPIISSFCHGPIKEKKEAPVEPVGKGVV